MAIGTTWALVAHVVGAVLASVDTTPLHGLFAALDRLILTATSLLILTIGSPTSGVISKSDSPRSVLSATEATFSTLSATTHTTALTKMMTATTRSGVNFVGMSVSVKAAVAINLEVIDR